MSSSDGKEQTAGAWSRKNVTHCSSISVMNTFSPRRMIQRQQAPAGRERRATGWLDEVDDAFDTLRAAERAMTTLYCLSVVFMAFSMVAIVLTSFLQYGPVKFGTSVVVVLESIAAIGLLIANVSITTVALKSTVLLNSWADTVGMNAAVGTKFLILTWSAWLAMLMALGATMFSRCWCATMLP